MQSRKRTQPSPQKGLDLSQYASGWMMKFSGSLVVLSIALNQIGFGKVVDAYADKLAAEAVAKPVAQCNHKDIEDRMKRLELMAHKPK